MTQLVKIRFRWELFFFHAEGNMHLLIDQNLVYVVKYCCAAASIEAINVYISHSLAQASRWGQ